MRTFAREAGAQSLVETALSLTFLVFLLIGGVDLARAYTAQTAVLNAARAGAEAGAMKVAATDPEIVQYARDELSRTPGIDAASATITATHDAPNSTLTVRVQYTYRTVVAWPGVPNTLALDRSAVFREY